MQSNFFVCSGGIVSGKPDNRRRASIYCLERDELKQKQFEKTPTTTEYRRKAHFLWLTVYLVR